MRSIRSQSRYKPAIRDQVIITSQVDIYTNPVVQSRLEERNPQLARNDLFNHNGWANDEIQSQRIDRRLAGRCDGFRDK